MTEETKEVCPDCKTPLVIRHEPNGQDDYNKVGYCPKCGATFTE